MLNRLAEGRNVDAKYQKKWKVRREGKDADDLFWMYGKIHGLENVAFVSDEDIQEANGDPAALQRLCDRANDSAKPLPPGSFDSTV